MAASGAAAIATLAVLLANQPGAQAILTTYTPAFNRLEPTVLTGRDLGMAVGLTVVIVGGVCCHSTNRVRGGRWIRSF